MVDENLEASALITVQPIGKISAQLAGEEVPLPRVPDDAQPVLNPTTRALH